MEIGPGWFTHESGRIMGRCKGCSRIFPAVGLGLIPDHSVFGEWKMGGWYCVGCKPEIMARFKSHDNPGTRPGWEEPPIGGWAPDEWVKEEEMRPMSPLGAPRRQRGETGLMKPRKRKMRPMRAL